MLKLIGALLLAGGAGALGCSAAAQLSRRVAVLRALLGALEGMEREIAFRLTPMPELLERAAAESPPPVCTLFARCRTLLDELGERSMAELWREALEQVPLGLDGPGRLALEELGEELKKIKKRKIVVGDGAKLCYNALREQDSQMELAPEPLRMQSAQGVARAALEQIRAGRLVKGRELVPVYHRLSQAERERLERERQSRDNQNK